MHILQNRSFGYGYPVHPDALSEVAQVGRSEQPGAIPCRLHNRSQHMRHRTFSVRAGNVNGGIGLMRMPILQVQSPGGFQSGLVRAGSGTLEVGECVVQVMECLSVGHSERVCCWAKVSGCASERFHTKVVSFRAKPIIFVDSHLGSCQYFVFCSPGNCR